MIIRELDILTLSSKTGSAQLRPEYLQNLLAELGIEYTRLLIALIPVVDTDPALPSIAAFARRHYYRDAIKALKKILQEKGVSTAAFRLFCNSRLPEKALALLSGPGFIGRNSLYYHPLYGSKILIGGALLRHPDPLFTEGQAAVDAPAAPCTDCQACQKACPTNAIGATAAEFQKERCLQFLACSETGWDDRIRRLWGSRLYGCSICQDVCPWNSGIPKFESPQPPPIPRIPELLEGFLQNKPLKELLPRTALEASWVPRQLILRNLVLAAANSDFPEKTNPEFQEMLCAPDLQKEAQLAPALEWYWSCNKNTTKK